MLYNIRGHLKYSVLTIASMIFAEVENRRKKTLFNSFINHHIEYQPYIDKIYNLCYPNTTTTIFITTTTIFPKNTTTITSTNTTTTGNLSVAKPSVGWLRAEAIRDSFYLDGVFFYIHLHVFSNLPTPEISYPSATTTSTTTTTTTTIIHTLEPTEVTYKTRHPTGTSKISSSRGDSKSSSRGIDLILTGGITTISSPTEKPTHYIFDFYIIYDITFISIVMSLRIITIRYL